MDNYAQYANWAKDNALQEGIYQIVLFYATGEIGGVLLKAAWNLGRSWYYGQAAVESSAIITKNSIIEGFKFFNHAWRKSGLGRGATEELISNVITGARKAGTVITETGTGKFSGNVIKVFNHNGVKVAVDETRQVIMSIRPQTGFKLP